MPTSTASCRVSAPRTSRPILRRIPRNRNVSRNMPHSGRRCALLFPHKPMDRSRTVCGSRICSRNCVAVTTSARGGRRGPRGAPHAVAVEATGPTTRDTRSLGSRFPPNRRTVATGLGRAGGSVHVRELHRGTFDPLPPQRHRRRDRVSLSRRGGIGAFYWSDEGFGYALAARADRGPLLRISEIVHQQTSPDGARAKIPPAPGKST